MKKIAWIVATLLLIIVIGLAIVSVNKEDKQTETKQVAVIAITADSFKPSTLQISVGTQVTWMNDDSSPHKIASNPHPEHTDLSGLNSQDLGPRSTYSYTFSKPGTVNYHDHLNPTLNGTIIVK